jgi:hypothetical protein
MCGAVADALCRKGGLENTAENRRLGLFSKHLSHVDTLPLIFKVGVTLFQVAGCHALL